LKNGRTQGARDRKKSRGPEAAKFNDATMQMVFFEQPSSLEKSIFFAVDTAAVFLSVEAGFPGFSLPFRPALAEIPIVKLETICSGDLLPDVSSQIMFLIPAVEERRRKISDPLPVCDHGRSLKPMGVAESTPIPLTLHQASQEVFHGVSFGNENIQTLVRCVFPERIQPFLIFLIGMNVGIEEKTQEFDSLLTQDPGGKHRAGRTAYVKKEFHDENGIGLRANGKRHNLFRL